jgi:hypothetical protein
MKLRGLFMMPVLGLALAAGDLAPALAQRAGSRIGSDAGPGDGVKELRIIARCYVDKRTAAAARWLHLLPGESERQHISAEMATLEDCTDNDKLVMDGKYVSFKPASLRRPVAVAMVRRMILRGEVPAAVPASPPAPWYQAQLALQSKDFPVDARMMVAEDFGYCVAVKQWGDAVALVRADVDSLEEAKAIKALVPALGPCITADQTARLTADLVRQTVAEPIYHIVTDRGAGGQH